MKSSHIGGFSFTDFQCVRQFHKRPSRFCRTRSEIGFHQAVGSRPCGKNPNPLVDRADEIKMGRRLLCLPFPAESKNNRLRNSASRAEGFVGGAVNTTA